MRLKVTLIAGAGLVSLILLVVFADSTKQRVPNTNEPSPGVTSQYDADQLHEDYDMTGIMSDPSTGGPMYDGRQPDPQLEHSDDPAFVNDLEEHTEDMDRMLGEGTP